tara:strand:- start:4372 stop:5091 length:720 start_codon:yes stop_codon:yes gene_type:complete
MEKERKVKIFLALSYLLVISLFLWVFFNNYSLEELTSYDFIKTNREFILEIKNNNIFLISFIFFIGTVLWVLMLGFGSPVCLLSGFIFGKWLGTIITIFGLTVGATLLYIFANFFIKDIIEKKFSKKFKYLNEKFKNNEFIFFLIYRFIGGIPFFISNILPTLFNVKIKNFFFGSIIGMLPQIFIMVSLGSGLEKIIEKNLNTPSFIEIIGSPEIYLPIIGFVILLFMGIIFQKKIYKN